MRFEPDCRFTKDTQGVYAVVDSSRAMPGHCGPVVTSHKSEAAAQKAARAKANHRVIKLNKVLRPGDQVNGQTDAIFGKVARMETPTIARSKIRFMPTVREGGR
jgi:hypothetical protein